MKDVLSSYKNVNPDITQNYKAPANKEEGLTILFKQGPA